MTKENFLSFSFFNSKNLDVAGNFLTHTSPILFCTRARKLVNLYILANLFPLKKWEKSVHGTGFTVHCKAESLAINSTGQRPVDTDISQQPALKGRNPAIDSMMPRRVGCTKYN
ncbi:MAG: hypothetical protein LBM08_08845 [Dysgonamonadaceae bacterium]|nr:hypothetical protein [Dysgonamonadaceae bacterium]